MLMGEVFTLASLPNELLSSIAAYLDHRDRVTSTHLCRRLRTVITGDARLWNRIVWQCGEDPYVVGTAISNPDALMLAIERAGSIPFHLQLRVHKPLDPDHVAQCLATFHVQAPKLRALEILMQNYVVVGCVELLPVMPNVQHLALEAQFSNRLTPSFSSLFITEEHNPAPALRTLRASLFRWNHVVRSTLLQSLTALDVELYMPTASEIRNILISCPDLRLLRVALHGDTDEDELGLMPIDTNLRSLSIQCTDTPDCVMSAINTSVIKDLLLRAPDPFSIFDDLSGDALSLCVTPNFEDGASLRASDSCGFTRTADVVPFSALPEELADRVTRIEIAHCLLGSLSGLAFPSLQEVVVTAFGTLCPKAPRLEEVDVPCLHTARLVGALRALATPSFDTVANALQPFGRIPRLVLSHMPLSKSNMARLHQLADDVVLS
ncbi:hypothetical protein EXIGLDRAFT_761629 [Exidia glandulosa HHB12029]|uniref:F-box domain-containing protein n=1 Tax=Exidia glandulosa HHB12029 TaxID=1314781 RepID=A0A165NCF3_EXIGL|nr:hypothetical protein EXIGLDRAFT_761629 [Exidia glandulosa HHB12029]